MKKTTSGDLNHVTSGPGDRRVGPSRNPVAMTDLQRRLFAGKAGLLELALLKESHRRLVEEAKGRLEEQTRRAAKNEEEQTGNRRSQRSVSESFNGAPEVSSSSSSSDDEDEEEDEDEEDGAGSSVDEVFYNNSILSNQRPTNSSTTTFNKRLLATVSSSNNRHLATVPNSNNRLLATVPSSNNRLIATDPSSNNRLLATDPSRPTTNNNSSSKAKHRRRMSEMQCRGSGKSSFHRTFNGIRLSAHRRRSEGTFLGVLLHRRPGRPIRDDCLSDSFRKPVTISGLTFDFPSPQHAVLAQFGLAGREVRSSEGPAPRCPHPSEGGSKGSSGSDVRKDRDVGFQGGVLVGREGWVTGESENTLLLPWRIRERSAVSESSLFYPQRSRIRLGDIASVHPEGQNLFSKSIEQEDLSETLAAVSSTSSKVEEHSSEDDHSKRQDPELERGSSEEKDPEEQGEVLDIPKESVSRPRLSRTTLYQLSEEGYFSGSDCQPSSGSEPSQRRRGRTGSRSSPKRSNSKESSRTISTANSTETELKQDTSVTSGSGPSTVQSETRIETLSSSSSKIFIIYC